MKDNKLLRCCVLSSVVLLGSSLAHGQWRDSPRLDVSRYIRPASSSRLEPVPDPWTSARPGERGTPATTVSRSAPAGANSSKKAAGCTDSGECGEDGCTSGATGCGEHSECYPVRSRFGAAHRIPGPSSGGCGSDSWNLHRLGEDCGDEGCQTPGCDGEDCTGDKCDGDKESCGYDCSEGCDDYCSRVSTCCHRSRVFGDYLYLSAGNVDYRYALPVNGTTATATPVGRGGMVQPEHSSGYRVGGAFALSDCSSLVVTYWNYESSVSSGIALPGGGGNFLRALPAHPNTVRVDTDSLFADALYEIDFQMIDGDFQFLIAGNCDWAINGRAGVRWGDLDQRFAGDYRINGLTEVDTEIDFSGIGPRFGLDMEKCLGRGVSIYATTSTSFLFGEFEGDFLQQNVFDGVLAADGFTDYRMVPVFELESGVNWTSPSGCMRFGAGYYWSSWFNTMTTPTFIDAVHTADYDDVSETLMFDGLTVRAEVRF